MSSNFDFDFQGGKKKSKGSKSSKGSKNSKKLNSKTSKGSKHTSKTKKSSKKMNGGRKASEFITTQNKLREYITKAGCKSDKGLGPQLQFMKWLRDQTKEANSTEANKKAISYFDSHKDECIKKFKDFDNKFVRTKRTSKKSKK